MSRPSASRLTPEPWEGASVSRATALLSPRSTLSSVRTMSRRGFPYDSIAPPAPPSLVGPPACPPPTPAPPVGFVPARPPDGEPLVPLPAAPPRPLLVPPPPALGLPALPPVLAPAVTAPALAPASLPAVPPVAFERSPFALSPAHAAPYVSARPSTTCVVRNILS